MSAATPAAGEPPPGPDRIPSIPDEVWDRFLTDTEERIVASAPREPAARDRTAPAVSPAGRRADAGPVAGRRRTAGWWRYLRPVLVLLVIAALALITFYPSVALSWVDDLFGIKPGGTACATALYNAKCRAGELPWNSEFRTSVGVVRVVR